MLTTPTVRQIGTDQPAVYAFRISGAVRPADMSAMARVVNEAFDVHPRLSMLLVLEDYDLGDAVRSLTPEVLKSGIRAVAHVDRYAVVGAPAAAAAMIGLLNPLIPTEARTFGPAQESEAWTFVGAHPLGDNAAAAPVPDAST